MRTLFYHGKIVCRECILENGAVLVCDGKIEAVYEKIEMKGETSARGIAAVQSGSDKEGHQGKIQENGQMLCFDESVNLDGDYLSPGFLDIHVHGGGSGDFMDGTIESFEKAMKVHLAHGTTGLCPTTLTASMEELERVMELCRVMQQRDSLCFPEILGLHLEGPYIAEVTKGAQDASYIRSPKDGSYEELFAKGKGILKILTAAPELEGADKMAEAAVKAGILLSVGHSDGRFEDAETAVREGYTMATHLYSSMSTIVRENGMRRPGILEAALLLDDLKAEVIADGMHLPASLLRLIIKTKGCENVILVTDAMRGAGMEPGYYKLGSLKAGQEVYSDGQIARMPDGISFAGSVATADRLIRTMVTQAGVTLPQAVFMMTETPARALGLKEHGALREGNTADLVRFGENIEIKSVYRRGKRAV